MDKNSHFEDKNMNYGKRMSLTRIPKSKMKEKISLALEVDQSILFSNHPNKLINIYIDLYCLLLDGQNVMIIFYILEKIKGRDKENFNVFERIITL